MKCEIKFKIKFLVFLILSTLLVVLDQFTKYLATVNLKNQDPFVLIKNVLELNYLDGGNKGAAWGILSGKITFFIIITMIVCILLIAVIIRLERLISEQKERKNKFFLLQLVFVLLLSGAIGNVIDRIINGYVVDFIYFKLIDFPVFNVADCYVTISAIILLIICIFFLSDEEFTTIFSIRKNRKKEK